MHTNIRTVCAAALALCVAAAGAADKLSSKEQAFLKDAAGGNMYEVEVGKLAQQKASDGGVKSFGDMLQRDHGKSLDELKALASSKGVTLPDALPRKLQASHDKLAKLSGTAFDKQFIQQVGLKDHRADIRKFEDASRSAKDPDVKAYADKTLPALREHLAHAQGLERGKPAAAGSSGNAGTAVETQSPAVSSTGVAPATGEPSRAPGRPASGTR